MPPDLMYHPVMPTLLMCVLSFYPVFRIYRRVGFNGLWAGLIFASLLVPFSGFLLVILPLAVRAWPNFPKPPEKQKPLKMKIV